MHQPWKPGLVSAAQNYNHSTTCARQASCKTRLRIITFKRPQRLAAKTSICPKIFISRFGRSFRNSFNKTNCQLCQLQARSRGILYSGLYSKLVRHKGVRLSPLWSSNKSFIESNQETNSYRASGSCLEETILVASPSQSVLEKPSSLSTNQGSCTRPYKPSKSSPTVPEVNIRRLFYIRQPFENCGLSQKTIELMLSAHPKSTHKTYQSAWKKWDSWCRATLFAHH